jgi:hypothetical protein
MKSKILIVAAVAALALVVSVTGNAARAPHSITMSQYLSVGMGASVSSVIAKLGQPDNQTASSTKSLFGNGYTSERTLYYNDTTPVVKIGGVVMPTVGGGYQFSFTNGHLTAKYKT